MTKSTTTRRAAIANDLQFEQELDTVAALITSRAQLDAERAAALDTVNERYGSAIKSTDAEIKATVARCETYASKHRERLFTDGNDRSTETALAVYGFRSLPASLKLRNKKNGWDKVLAALKELGRTDLIRTEEAADKEVLERQSADLLKSVGLKYEGGEKFYVENKGDA